MSKFPLIGKNVLVIYGKQDNHFKELYVESGILKGLKKDEVTLQKLGVKKVLNGIILVTLYSKKLQEKEQMLQTEDPMPQKINLSADDIQSYLKSTDIATNMYVYNYNLNHYSLTKGAIPERFTVPEKYFKLLSLNIITKKATFQLLYLDMDKAKKNSKKETLVVEDIFALFNPKDFNEQTAGKLWRKKRTKRHCKRHSKIHNKNHSKKRTKRLT